jgi:hypothetical protein
MVPCLHMVDQSSDGQNKKRVQPIDNPSYSFGKGVMWKVRKKAESEVWVVWKTTHD